MVSETAYPREKALVAGEYTFLKEAEDAREAAAEEERQKRAVPEFKRESWWTRHGELVCASVAGVSLLTAVLCRTGAVREAVWESLVGVAFTLGFFYGVAAAWKSLRMGILDIHFLMVLGAVLAIFVGSAMEGAILLFLFTLSGALEGYAMQRTHAALESLMKLFPKEAVVVDETAEGEELQRLVKLEDLRIGDRVLVKPGENISADGRVTEGESCVDESPITGEYLPREKRVGSRVYAGTMNKSGRLVVRVEKPAHDTALAKVIHLVSVAREEKAPVERLFDRIGTWYTLGVLAMSVGACLVLALVWHLPWMGSGNAIYRAITLLIVASPCALIISTPVVLLSAIASCARKGIVLKGGRHLESLAGLKAIVFDKTGTLTSGKVRLVGIEFVDARHAPLHCDWPQAGSGKAPEDEKPEAPVAMSSSLRKEFAHSVAQREEQLFAMGWEKIGSTVLPHGEKAVEDLLLKVAAALEANSTHPLGAAVLEAAHAAGLVVPHVQEFVQESGVGLRGIVDGEPAILGSPSLLYGLCQTLSVNRLCERVSQVQQEGGTAVVIYFGGLAGLMRFTDTLRPDAKGMVERMHELGVRPVVMLTGDNRQVAQGVAQQVGVDEVHAEMMPEGKLAVVEGLVNKHVVVGMVGDGINDAPALARATVGIAMGSIGSDAALEAADVVLLNDRIDRLGWLIETSRRARKVMGQNLTFAIGVIVVLVTASFLGDIGLPLGVIGHEGSTVLVVCNGLRLLRVRD